MEAASQQTIGESFAQTEQNGRGARLFAGRSPLHHDDPQALGVIEEVVDREMALALGARKFPLVKSRLSRP